MKRLGISPQKIQEILEISSSILNEALEQEEDLTTEIKLRIETGQQEIYEVAKELECSEVLVWSVLLEGMDDYDRFQVLGWPRAMESFWNWTQDFSGFGDDSFKDNIRGVEEISPILIAHLLTYFVPGGGTIWVPETQSGIINDTCLAFGRRCRSWNKNNLRIRRPEIEQKDWSLDAVNAEDFAWPVTAKPDLFFVQAEFWTSKIRDFWEHDHEIQMREEVQEQLKNFFQKVHQNSKVGGRLALLVHEERNYLDHPVHQESPDQRFGQHEYSTCLEEAGWRCTHFISCPRPKLSYSKKSKKKFQQQLILPENNRTLLIASRLP